jgi:SAM-dependent methyltransferase
MSKRKPFDKYLYYENSVQTPEDHVKIYNRMFLDIRNRKACSLREDFCGTFLISCEWVKSDPERTAIGLDLDPEPVEYGMKKGFKKLSANEKKRVQVKLQDVCVPTKQKFDIIGAANFSFNIFKTREQLKKYFMAAKQSLKSDGIFNLELAGGAGFIDNGREQKTWNVKGIGRYTYYWDQKSFDPINHHGLYSIHFKTPDGVMHRDCFVYDWRIWTIPELKDLMLECGFKNVAVYWESCDEDGNGTDEYVHMEQGDNAHAWIAFVVGIK